MNRLRRSIASALVLAPLTLGAAACSGGDVDAEPPSVDVDAEPGDVDVNAPDVDAPDVEAPDAPDVDVDADVDADVEDPEDSDGEAGPDESPS